MPTRTLGEYQDGEKLVVLLAGGTKKCQSRDVANAQARWRDYRHRKRSK